MFINDTSTNANVSALVANRTLIPVIWAGEERGAQAATPFVERSERGRAGTRGTPHTTAPAHLLARDAPSDVKLNTRTQGTRT